MKSKRKWHESHRTLACFCIAGLITFVIVMGWAIGTYSVFGTIAIIALGIVFGMSLLVTAIVRKPLDNPPIPKG